MDVLAIAVGLGLAGVDVLGALTVLALLTAGASRKVIALFAGTVFFVTTAIGIILSLTLGGFVDELSRFASNLPDTAWVSIDLVVVCILWGWAARRWYRQSHNTPKIEKPKTNRWLRYGPLVIGGVFALSALTDPSFLAVIALAGHNGNILSIVFMHVLWVLVSQAPLFVLAIAVMSSKHERVTTWFRNV